VWERVDLAVSSLTDVSVDSRDNIVANFVPLQKKKTIAETLRLFFFFFFR